jgi:predicted MFS family arabinose efflux permease
MADAASVAGTPTRRDFAAYLGGSSLWLAGFNLQQFLVTWMLVGMLLEPGARVGLAQLLIAVPGFVLMLFGGGIADRVDGRRLLLAVHALAVLPPLLLAVTVQAQGLAYLTVIVFGVGVGALQGLSEPARVAMLNRVTAGDLQKTVVMTTAVTMTVGLAGTWLGGRTESLGLAAVLVMQAALFGGGGLAVLAIDRGLTRARSAPAERPSRVAEVAEGLGVLWRTPVVRDVIGLNFISSVFNAGAWFVVYPFLVTRVYDGDAALLALLSLVFFAGSIASNLGLLRFVPLARPGRLFLVMQLTRAVLFGILLLEPPIWVLALVSIGWGMNMGITTSTARMIVQAGAPEAQRARVLSVFILSTMSAAPLGALMLGTVVDLAGVLAGFVPGVGASFTIFVLGMTLTGLWGHRPAAPEGVSASRG